MPPPATQELFTGESGERTLISAFNVYKLFKQIIVRNYGAISRCENILDFGCGWGRITRFFLKDMDPSGIWGADCLPSIIEFCKQSNRWCNFRAVEPVPPTTFPDNMFDVIFSYSVFSHLSEDMHKKWLAEFRRILKPGGLVIATTRDRKFIQFCGELRAQENLSGHLKALTSVFPNTEQSLADYDRGSYCHHPLNAGEILNSSFFGETCIPRDYVLNHWTDHFTFIDYIYACDLQPQNVIVVKKLP
jgi:ubiquinone/menaquinone biosynthesis C-methylase UbiE